jgi:hypothetical protein
MSYFNYTQEKALKEILEDLVSKGNTAYAIKIKEHDLLGALDKRHYEETVKEDIEMVLENSDVELTESEMEEVMRLVFNYDHGDYNDFIDEMISMVKEGKE